MSDLVAALLTVLIPAMALSWLACWRANVRLARRLDRALRAVEEQAAGACAACSGEDGLHRSRCDLAQVLHAERSEGRRAA